MSPLHNPDLGGDFFFRAKKAISHVMVVQMAPLHNPDLILKSPPLSQGCADGPLHNPDLDRSAPVDLNQGCADCTTMTY